MKLRKTLTGILGVAVMALSVGSFSHVNEHKEVYAADTAKLDYKVTSKTAVQLQSSTSTSNLGTSATYSQTFSNTGQMTKGNSTTFTLKNLNSLSGYKISGLTLTMKSNKSDGAGTLSVKAGSTTIKSISSGTAFSNSAWYGKYTQSFVDVNFTNLTDYTILGTETISVEIKATTNSLYIQNYKFSFTKEADSSCTHSNTTESSKEATCLEDGYYKVTCNDCSSTLENETINALGHNYDNNVCTRCGKEVIAYTLVESVNALKAGDQVIIVASGYNVALSTTQNNNNRGQATVTKDTENKTVSFEEDTQVLTLEDGTKANTFAFNTGDGYLYAAGGSDKNYLRTEEKLSDNSSWTISINSNGVATIKANGTAARNLLRYNSADNNGKLFSCYASGQSDVSIYKYVDPSSSEVNALFASYYNNGSYVKETELNVNTATMGEIEQYFHAGAQVRHRKTTYTPGQLTMVTKENKEDAWGTSTSTYKDLGNNSGVEHLKDGKQDYTVSGGKRSSVENWFVTLHDFNETTFKDWKCENGVYTLSLTENATATTMAREFVAPMWLNTEEAVNYVTFDKLTVEEVETSLVMKLYVVSGNSGQLVNGANLVFSQAIITK